MTTDPTPDRNDPLRALDAVEPADRWDDVVSRSTEAELIELAPVAARRSMPRPLLAAAAVLAVVALAAGVFALTRGDDGPQNLATDGAAGRVATIWNSTWELVALERGGEAWPVEPALDGSNPLFYATEPGADAILFQACNQGAAIATVEGDSLVVTEFYMTEMACGVDDGDGNFDSTLMDQEEFVTDLLADRPTIVIARKSDGGALDGFGDRLTLTTANGSATFERTEIGGPFEGGTGSDDPEGSVSSPSQPPAEPGVPGSNSPQGPVETVAPSTPQGFFDAIWGRKWTVVKITDNGQERSMVTPTDGNPLSFDANRSSYGSAVFNGCNGAGGTFESDGTRLLMTKELDTSTAGRCASDALMAQEAWLQSFLAAGPSFVVEGDNLTLTTDQATIELVSF